jgi:hypothetical protein
MGGATELKQELNFCTEVIAFFKTEVLFTSRLKITELFG